MEVIATPVTATWELDPEVSIELDRSVVFDVSRVLVPYNMAHYRLGEFRMRNGWPVEVPPYDVRAHALTSVSGDRLTYRPAPAQVITQAAVRWIAGDSYDTTALKWRPSVGFPGWTWESAAEFAPTAIEEYSYRVDREIVVRPALHFNEDAHQHMWSNFAGAMTSATSFSFLMVLNLNSSASADTATPNWSGILSPGHPTPGGATTFAEPVVGSSFAIQVRGKTLFANPDQTGFKQMYSIAPMMERTAPCYLGVTVTPPYLYVYAGNGPSTLRYAMVECGTDATTMAFVLGRSTGTLLHGADMSVFDLGFYVDPLTKEQMVSQVAVLAGSYGGK